MQSIYMTLTSLQQGKYVCASDLAQALLQKSDLWFPSAAFECQSQSGKSSLQAL